MADRDIIFEDLTKPGDLYRLKDYLKELFRLGDKRFIAVDYAATVVFDADEGDIFYVELTGNVTTITIKHPYKGRKITIVFKQDATGSRTISGWAATVMLAGNAFSVTSNANRYTTLTLVNDDTNWVETSRTNDVY